MLKIRLALVATMALTLTACPDNNPTSSSSDQLARYAGVWVRTNEYCDYMTNNYGPTDYRCNDIAWENNNSLIGSDEDWLMIAIDRRGGINRFLADNGAQSNGNWGLGLINKDGFYTGYAQTYESGRQIDVIRVYVDGEFLTIFNETAHNRVGYLRLTAQAAREFETAYFDCGSGMYCKGRNSQDTKGQRQTRRQQYIQPLEKFDQRKYDECRANEDGQEICKCIAYGYSAQECKANLP